MSIYFIVYICVWLFKQELKVIFLIVLGGRDALCVPSVSLFETVGIPGCIENALSSVGIVPLDFD